MPRISNAKSNHQGHKFNLGQIVSLKSYYGKVDGKEILVAGDPQHLPPLMVITGIEIEDKKKVTHDKELGEKIAERIKYHVMWFDNKESVFVNKVLYESFLDADIIKSIVGNNVKPFQYKFGNPCDFKTAELEIKKKKISTSFISDNYSKFKGQEPKANESKNERDQEKKEPLMSFVCPKLLCSAILKNPIKSTFDHNGDEKTIWPELLVKVMWFNYQQQKYSEAELPLECLVETK